jgi:hypothetical protein
MPLSKQEIERLLQLVGLTKDRELNCEECLALVAEFAEQQLAGKSVSAGLKAVEQHLSICGECREEYEALQQTLSAMDNTGA